MQYLTTALALLPTVALAQNYGYGDSSSTTTGSAAAATTSAAAIPGIHVVKVGADGLKFTPNNITAAVGEVVEFHFWPKAHSVAQSSFQDPCQPLNQTAGFFSGPVAIASGMSPEVFSITINNTNPIWYYCATGTHCQSGMAGVINPPANKSRTIEVYQAAAKEATDNVAPAEVKGGSLGAAATVAPTPASSTSAAPSGSSTPGAGVRESVPWVLMGAVVGGLFV